MKIYLADYYGFVYIWFDRKQKMFYIGSHMGSLNDNYKGSSLRFNRAIKKRPYDFKRKILFYCKTHNRKVLLKEEERWLQMIKPKFLQVKYYNVKRSGTGGFVTEGYNSEQREKYIKKLHLRKGRGGNHYSARKCVCFNKHYDSIADAKREIGFNPVRRLYSRRDSEFYFVDEGPLTNDEIEFSKNIKIINQQNSINAMKKRNLELPNEHHKMRTTKAHNKRKENNNLKWSKPKEHRIGRKISIFGVIYENLNYAFSITNIKPYFLRKYARDVTNLDYFFI